jgi:hypothetical protein
MCFSSYTFISKISPCESSGWGFYFISSENKGFFAFFQEIETKLHLQKVFFWNFTIVLHNDAFDNDAMWERKVQQGFVRALISVRSHDETERFSI